MGKTKLFFVVLKKDDNSIHLIRKAELLRDKDLYIPMYDRWDTFEKQKYGDAYIKISDFLDDYKFMNVYDEDYDKLKESKRQSLHLAELYFCREDTYTVEYIIKEFNGSPTLHASMKGYSDKSIDIFKRYCIRTGKLTNVGEIEKLTAYIDDPRTRYAIRRSNVESIQELVQMISNGTIKRLRGVGDRTVLCMIDALNEMGYNTKDVYAKYSAFLSHKKNFDDTVDQDRLNIKGINTKHYGVYDNHSSFDLYIIDLEVTSLFNYYSNKTITYNVVVKSDGFLKKSKIFFDECKPTVFSEKDKEYILEYATNCVRQGFRNISDADKNSVIDKNRVDYINKYAKYSV